ncbi:SulP family inorganic anion transporter [Tropicimonas sp. TH_r6]|uniref:SulP family inorganic anion transporter n=1 Tax=Tropicimonas sp. TH_r6 TaxID=3082085 RepID=UPI002954BED7|nr:SulP family inorganic anion transporter [Tropicimonas sp. TH_r6]MDV7143954.1 SulP family inorganic anion transporter [Tropicimonas sp. TH_r6]
MTLANSHRLTATGPAEIGVGLLAGTLSSLFAVSFAYIIFAGPLSMAAGDAMRLALLGTLVAALAALARRHFAGTLWQTQSVVAVVLGLAAAKISGDASAPTQEVAVATVMVLVVVTALATGALMLLIGLARLGQVVKSVPYPVVGGFLAATGCLLVLRAVQFGVGDLSGLEAYLAPEALPHWLAPVLLAVLMLVVEPRFGTNATVICGSVLLSAAVYGGLAWTGMSLEAARDAGILLEVEAAPGGWTWSLSPEVLARVDWDLLVAQYPLIGAAAILAALGALLNLSAIEFSTGEPIDPDGELRHAGLANLLAGLGGGLVCYQSTILTQLSAGLPDRTRRIVPVVYTAVVLGVMVAGAELLNLLPRSLFSLLLAYLGLGFLHRWLVVERARLPRYDFLIVLLILVVTLLAGFVWAVLTGIVVASLRFTIAYARLPVLRSAVTGAVRLSSTERSEEATRRLVARGGETLIFEAQGYMFFGTANTLYSKVHRALEERLSVGERVRHLVLDLSRVQGVDVSAIFMFDRLARQARRNGVDVIFTGLETERADAMLRGVEHGDVVIFPTLDGALIALEEEALNRSMAEEADAVEELDAFEAGFRTLLDRIGAAGAPVDFQSHEVAAGTRIFEMGAEADSLLVLDAGRLYATMREGEHPAMRVATFLPGAVVGEIGLVTGGLRTASIIAETDCILRVVTRAELAALQAFDADMALEMSAQIASLLAHRLARTTALLHAVSR